MASISQVSQPQRRSSVARIATAFLFRPRRSLFLPVSALVVGLVAASIGLFRPAPRVLTAVPPGYAALVNQKGLLISDYRAQVETETGKAFADTSPAERSRILREMINEELLVQRAVVLDLPETTNEVRTNMAIGVNTQVAAPVLAYEPTDAELRAFYDQHRQNYTAPGSMTLQDLVLHIGGYQNADQTVSQAQADATEAVYQLRSGTSVDYVMEHFGFMRSGRAADGEELDFAAKLHLGDKLYQVAMTLHDGEISDPVQDWDGMHILVMQRHEFPKVADFSAVRDRVYLDYRTAAANRATEQNLSQLRRQANILLAPGLSE
ncbi:MAG TPA: peptidylprolyl isomerase [Steroidobacteraceae bacterium]|nr:peptidylprolyl isomerase [Steroidobacteraceae bacterium]